MKAGAPIDPKRPGMSTLKNRNIKLYPQLLVSSLKTFPLSSRILVPAFKFCFKVVTI